MKNTQKIIGLLKNIQVNAMYSKQLYNMCKDSITESEYNAMNELAKTELEDVDKILSEIEIYGEPYEFTEETPEHQVLLKVNAVEDTSCAVSMLEPNEDTIKGMFKLVEELNDNSAIKTNILFEAKAITLEITVNFSKEELLDTRKAMFA